MCGIAGMFGHGFRGRVDPQVLAAMMNSIAHRGPDEEGVFIRQEEGVGLGHRRLSIIDLKTGQQPMASIDGSIQIVFNGEIYNFRELRQELQKKGYRFRTNSDTEVIIYIYAEYGEKGFERLNGIFSFAIYDQKKHSLVIARDYFGVKPLYYAQVGGGMLFASEIKAILCHPSFKKELDFEALNSFFTFRYNPSPQTLFKGVRKLAPGHFLKMSPERVLETGSYWSYSPVTHMDITETEAVMEYKRLLENAVERQMISDVPVGLLLSGGVDSAVLGYLMRRFSTSRIKAFTIGFKGKGDFNELADARKTADLLGLEHHERELSENEYMDFFFKSFSHTEEPIAETTIPALYYVAQLAAKHVKVVLAGQGADEPMAGYLRYVGVKYISQYSSLLGALPLSGISGLFPRSEKLKRAAYAAKFHADQQRFLAAYTIFTPEQKRKLFNDETQKKIKNIDAELIERLYAQCGGLHDALSKIMFIDTRMSLADSLLLFNDKMTMANSIEMRVPFLDVELIKFLETLPSSLKLKGKTGKYIHKKAVAKWLPAEIIYRKKRGFETPMDQWLHGELASVTQAIINETDSACSQYFNLNRINTMIGLHRSGREDFHRHIFCLLSFEIWHRSFFGGREVTLARIQSGLTRDRNRVKWYINRLSLMSPAEIGYRLVKEAKERRLQKRGVGKTPEIEPGCKWLFGPETRFPLWDGEKEKKVLERKFNFFAFKDQALGAEIDWHKDYKNNKRAPVSASFGIDFRDPEIVGDIKYVWELNRQQHLVGLAKAYKQTGDLRYKEEALRQIGSWIDANPFLQGANWASSLELSVRLISWAWVWNFIGDIESEFKEKWLQCIFQHGSVISRNFSRYSSAGNHLIGEASGLFIGSLLWPFEGLSKKWKKQSFEILNEEIERQTYSDGVGKEQAVSYQQFVLDFFLLAGRLGELNGVPFPKPYWERIEQMMEFIASLMDPHGNMPNLGDSDDGFAIVLSESKDFNPYRSLLATGAVIFKRGDFKEKAQEFDEKSFWLLGENGRRIFQDLSPRLYFRKKQFAQGGYYLLCDKDILCVFDCGPLGYLSLAAHGHADALSFTLSVGGNAFLIDPGTYAYHTHEEWRNYFRGTLAHNTIRVDRQDQSVIGGNFMWLRKARSRFIKYESNDRCDLVLGEHDGYYRLRDKVLHQREILFNKEEGSFKIIDRIKCRKKHFIEQSFHLAHGCRIDQAKEDMIRISHGGRAISIRRDGRMKQAIFKGSLDPIAGWESKRYDVKEEAYSLVNTVEVEGSCEFETNIIVERS